MMDAYDSYNSFDPTDYYYNPTEQVSQPTMYADASSYASVVSDAGSGQIVSDAGHYSSSNENLVYQLDLTNLRDECDTCSFYPNLNNRIENLGISAPPYLMNYGNKYCQEFAAPGWSVSGAQWRDDTMINLQDSIIIMIEEDRKIILDHDRFKAGAFDTHPDAYWDAGMYDRLEPGDYLKILNIIDGKDLVSPEGRRQIYDIGDRYINEFINRNIQ